MRVSTCMTILIGLLGTGCEDSLSAAPFVSDADFIDALPRTDDHTLSVSPASGRWSAPDDLPSEEDGWPDLLELSLSVASSLNGITMLCLDSVDAVAQTEPSYRSATARSWQAQSIDGNWMVGLDMTRSKGVYGWTLEASPSSERGDALPTICGGTHDPDSGSISRGSGRFDVWLDNWEGLGGATGTLETRYDLTAGQELQVTIDSLGDFDSRPENGDYYFWKDPSGGGDFQYRTTGVLEGGGDVVLEVRTRWNPDGTGRSDAIVSGGELPSDTDYLFSECFDGWTKVWRWTNYGGGFERGAEGACAFSTAAEVDRIGDSGTPGA